MSLKDQILTYVAYAVIATLLIGGGFYAYQKYYPSGKNNNNQNQEALKEYIIAGQVVSINKDVIKVKIKDDERDIKTTSRTTINKLINSPLGVKNISIALDGLQIGRSIEITLAKNSSANNLIAEKINIYNKNVILGYVQSINNENIFITGYGGAQILAIKITNQTLYYKAIESGEPVKINFDTIKANDFVTIFLTDDTINKNMVADSIEIQL